MKKRLLTVTTGLAVGTAALLGLAAPASASISSVAAYDVTGDGWNETYFVDSNGDGWYDLAAFDFDLDGWRDGVAADLDQNGVFELYFFDSNENGYSELYAADDNQDGYFDRIARDGNENGVEDSNETMIQSSAVMYGAPTYDVGPTTALLALAGRTGVAAWPDRDVNNDGYDDY